MPGYAMPIDLPGHAVLGNANSTQSEPESAMIVPSVKKVDKDIISMKEDILLRHEEKKSVRAVLVTVVKLLRMWKRFLARQLLLCLRLSISVLTHAMTCSSFSMCLNDTSRAMKLKASTMLSLVDIVSSLCVVSCQPLLITSSAKNSDYL